MSKNLNELISIMKYQAEFDDRWGDLNNKELTELGVTDIEIGEMDENIRSFSTDVDWSTNLKVTFKNKRYLVYLSGEATADISYDRWETTSFYRIDEDCISVIEIGKE